MRSWNEPSLSCFLYPRFIPFNDGNGRIARIMMNCELESGGEARIIIPTVFRDDYIGGLRRFTRESDPSVLIKALRFAHDYAAGIDFSDVTAATTQLEETNAFEEPDSSKRHMLPLSLFGS